MIDKRKIQRRHGDRRNGSDRRKRKEDDIQWLPPYGRRNLGETDRRKGERRLMKRRSTD